MPFIPVRSQAPYLSRVRPIPRISPILYTFNASLQDNKIHPCHKLIIMHTISQQKARRAYTRPSLLIKEGTFDMLMRGLTPLPARVCRLDTHLDIQGEAYRNVP